MLLYTAAVVPYKLSFVDESSLWLDLLVDASFITDMVLTFMTALELKHGLFEVRHKVIAYRYIKGFFFLDLVTSFPFQLFEKMAQSSDQNNVKLLRIVRINRLYRLLRIFRLLKLLRLLRFTQMKLSKNSFFAFFANLGSQYKTFIKLTITVFFFNHVMACFWFMQAKL